VGKDVAALVGEAVVGDVVGESTTVVVAATVPYVVNEVKTVAGRVEILVEKAVARVELVPNSTMEATVTLPASMDTTVTAEVDTPAETDTSDLNFAVNSEVNVSSSKLTMSRVEKVTLAETRATTNGVGEAVVGETVVGETVVGETLLGEAVVGEAVGAAVVGEAVVGKAVVGEAVAGEAVVGEAVVGEAVVGETVVGDAVGENVEPRRVGDPVGDIDVGETVVGEDVGDDVGVTVGEVVVGDAVVGDLVGEVVVGVVVVGAVVGAGVAMADVVPTDSAKMAPYVANDTEPSKMAAGVAVTSAAKSVAIPSAT